METSIHEERHCHYSATLQVRVPWRPGTQIGCPPHPTAVKAIAHVSDGDDWKYFQSVADATDWLEGHPQEPSEGKIVLTYTVSAESPL